MSTYLLAWTVNKYESAKSTSARGVKFEAFYLKAYSHPCNYSYQSYESYESCVNGIGKNASIMQHPADVGAKMLDHFEQKVFVGLNYNLPKMDIVAVERYAFGAMENWGMMVFRAKLFKTQEYFYLDKIMAHELVTGHFIISS